MKSNEATSEHRWLSRLRPVAIWSLFGAIAAGFASEWISIDSPWRWEVWLGRVMLLGTWIWWVSQPFMKVGVTIGRIERWQILRFILSVLVVWSSIYGLQVIVHNWQQYLTSGLKGSDALRLLAYELSGALLYLAVAVTAFCICRWARGGLRRSEGKCVRCGYLLQGLSHLRCPECGSSINPGRCGTDGS